MKLKLALGIVGLVVISIVAGRSEKVSARYGQSATALPTPGVAVKREYTFLDSWDGVKLKKADAIWKSELNELEFYVLRKQGTERAYTGELTDNKAEGTYYCNACGLAVFSSKHKYDSETGWPSFYKPIDKKHVGESVDRSIPGEDRTEVHCNRCGGHLGHVFDDGPEPTGLRYCINSVSLRFRAK
ncbi:MAG: peptide-methionine (R)-S-oxide reductase MsrB [Pyrinomonadaceae bacterium]